VRHTNNNVKSCIVTWLQVKHNNVIQVSLIIVSVNSSTHVGRYTLTASNVAGTATANITLRLTASSSLSLSTSSYSDAHRTAADDDVKDLAVAVRQHPDTEYQQLSGTVMPHRIDAALLEMSYAEFVACKSIRSREGWQVGNAAFCQITLDICLH